MPRSNPRLPHHLHTRLSSDQWELLEVTADALDLTLSGAIRHHLDLVLDRPVTDDEGAPTRRQLMSEKRGEVELPDGTRFTLQSVTRAEEHAPS